MGTVMGDESQASFKDVTTTIKDTQANSAGVNTATVNTERRTTYISRFLTALWSLALLFAYLLRRGCNIVVGALTKSSGDMVNIARIAMAKLFAIFSFIMMSLLVAQTASAQTTVCDGNTVRTFNFTNATLLTGMDLMPGAVYGYTNIANGVDGRVRIVSFNNGAELVVIDNDAGAAGSLQPELDPNPNGDSFVVLEVSFIDALTGAPVTVDVSATQIDVDGNNQTLREFVEYESQFAQFTVNNPTLLALGASGPGDPSRTRIETTTSTVAPGIDPTAFENIARANYFGVTSFQYAIGTVGAGATNRLTSLDFQCPTLPNPVSTAGPGTFNLDKTLTSNMDEDGSGTVSIGDTLTYTIVATNSGVAVQNVVIVTDNLITPNTNTCPTLAVGGTCTLEGDYVVQASDAGGDIVNTASVTSNEVTTLVTDSVTTPADPPAPALNLSKPAPTNADEDSSGTVSVGDTLTYTITATNNGNIDQTDVVVSDPMLVNDSTITCASVPVNGTCVLTGTYVVAAGDAGGDIVNTAEAASNEVTSPVDATQTTPVPAAPALDIVKTQTSTLDNDGSGSISIGDTLDYEIVVTNSGNIVQNNVVVTDNLITPNSNTCATVAVGATCTLTGTYVVTMTDAGGDVVNTASAVSDEVTTLVTDTVTTPVVGPAPSLDLDKSLTTNADEDSSGTVSIGDTLTYTIIATNDGNLDQTDVVVSDPMLVNDSTITCPSVPVGGTCELTGEYVVTMADAGGNIVNTASAESDEVTTPVTDTVTTPVVGPAPSLDLDKSLTTNADEDSSGTVSIGDLSLIHI